MIGADEIFQLLRGSLIPGYDKVMFHFIAYLHWYNQLLMFEFIQNIIEWCLLINDFYNFILNFKTELV